MANAQAWLERNFSVSNPVDELVSRSGVPERTFKRRFTQATGMPPLDFVQRPRIELAKLRLEQSDTAIHEVGWAVGYEDPTSLRKLFSHSGRARHLPAQIPRARPRRTRRSLSQNRSASSAFRGRMNRLIAQVGRQRRG